MNESAVHGIEMHLNCNLVHSWLAQVQMLDSNAVFLTRRLLSSLSMYVI